MENEIPATPAADEETDQKLIRTIKKNEKYVIKFLSTNKKLYIQCIEETFPNPKYENKYSLNSLINVHKYFQAYDDINEVSSFIESIDENSIKIDKNKNNENIILSIKVTFKEKSIDIDFKLIKTQANYDKISLDLFNEINKTKDEIRKIKNVNDHLIKENQLIKKQCEDLKVNNRLIENKCTSLDEKFNNLKNIYEDLNEDNQLINIEYENSINGNYLIRNKTKKFIRNNKKIILLFCLFLFLVLVIIVSPIVIKFITITNRIDDIKEDSNKTLSNISNKIKKNEIYINNSFDDINNRIDNITIDNVTFKSITNRVKNIEDIEVYYNKTFKNIIDSIDNIKEDNNKNISIIIDRIKNIEEIDDYNNKTFINISINIDNIKGDNNNLKSDVNNIKNSEVYNKKEINKIIKRLDDKEIYYNKEIISFINDTIKGYLKKNISSVKLLYDAKLYGDSAQQFHENCNEHNNALVIIETDKGKIFGGFTTLSWDDGNQYEEKGIEGFLFNYNNKTIYYKHNYPDTQIMDDTDCGPIFGYEDLVISDKCLHYKHSYEKTGCVGNSYETYGKKYVLNGEEYFKVYNYKVYELFFEN